MFNLPNPFLNGRFLASSRQTNPVQPWLRRNSPYTHTAHSTLRTGCSSGPACRWRSTGALGQPASPDRSGASCATHPPSSASQKLPRFAFTPSTRSGSRHAASCVRQSPSRPSSSLRAASRPTCGSRPRSQSRGRAPSDFLNGLQQSLRGAPRAGQSWRRRLRIPAPASPAPYRPESAACAAGDSSVCDLPNSHRRTSRLGYSYCLASGTTLLYGSRWLNSARPIGRGFNARLMHHSSKSGRAIRKEKTRSLGVKASLSSDAKRLRSRHFQFQAASLAPVFARGQNAQPMHGRCARLLPAAPGQAAVPRD